MEENKVCETIGKLYLENEKLKSDSELMKEDFDSLFQSKQMADQKVEKLENEIQLYSNGYRRIDEEKEQVEKRYKDILNKVVDVLCYQPNSTADINRLVDHLKGELKEVSDNE